MAWKNAPNFHGPIYDCGTDDPVNCFSTGHDDVTPLQSTITVDGQTYTVELYGQSPENAAQMAHRQDHGQ